MFRQWIIRSFEACGDVRTMEYEGLRSLGARDLRSGRKIVSVFWRRLLGNVVVFKQAEPWMAVRTGKMLPCRGGRAITLNFLSLYLPCPPCSVQLAAPHSLMEWAWSSPLLSGPSIPGFLEQQNRSDLLRIPGLTNHLAPGANTPRQNYTFIYQSKQQTPTYYSTTIGRGSPG